MLIDYIPQAIDPCLASDMRADYEMANATQLEP